MTKNVGILHPGLMGAIVAEAIKNSGHQVCWASEERSLATRRRAEKIGLIEVSTIAELCNRTEIIFCICPPYAASDMADAVLQTEFAGLYVDCNATSPKRATEIAQKFKLANAAIDFVDGSIIGIGLSGKTSLYLSGLNAVQVPQLFKDSLFETEVIGTEIGKASAIKMCFSAIEKGVIAQYMAVFGAAAQYGVLDVLEKQCLRWTLDDVEQVVSREGANYVERKKQLITFLSDRMWRYTNEMEEVSQTFAEVNIPIGLFQFSAEIYERFSHFKDIPIQPEFDDILAVFNSTQKPDMIDDEATNSPLATYVLPDPTLPLDDSYSECIHSAFTQIATTIPDQIAVTGHGISLSYREINELSNKLANYLLAQDAKGKIVAIYAQRSPTLIWAMIGILKAGAAFLILDSKYPRPRLTEYCRQAEPSIVLGLEETDPLPTEITANGIPSLRLPKSITDANQKLQAYSPNLPQISISPHDLAYVAFTSGSTGKPKGIVGNHAPVAHFIAWDTHTFDLTSSDCFSLLSGLSHDVLLRDIFVPLSIGAKICVPNELDLSPGRLTDWLAEQHITVVHLTPSMGQFIIANNRILDNLQYFFFGGDKLPALLVKALAQQAPEAKFINFYGATETPQAMGFLIISDNKFYHVDQPTVIPIGRGIQDTQLLILDENLKLVDIGEVGEIAIRTPYLTRGYLNDNAETRKKYIPNPYTQKMNDIIYKSGDLGRYLSDGNIEFLGRSDDQVELRGYRVELREIEATLNAHPDITQSKVVMHQSVEEKYLVGYVITQKSSINTLRSYLLERLPSYMVPSLFMQLEQFPLTPNGKIDTKALPLPQRLRPTDEYVAARTDPEKGLVAIWEEVLNIHPVGINDNFFELGGHSLLAIQVIARVRQIFLIELLLHHLFEFPTIATLANQLDRMKQNEPLKISPVSPPPTHIPISSTQQNLWPIVKQSEQAHSALNVVLTRLIIGPLNIATLRRSLSEVVRRHENLRTTFTFAEGQPCQVINPPQTTVLPIIEIKGLSENEQLDKVRIMTSQELQCPFDLEQGPLWRATLYRLAEDKHILSVTIDHIIFDTLSSTIFMDELWTLYETFQQNRASSLPPLKIQYKDFSVWQHQRRQEKLKEGLAYWKKYLSSDLPIPKLPYDSLPEQETFTGERFSLKLSRTLSEKLKEFSQSEGSTLFITLLTALKVLLVRYTHQNDILVGTPIAGRDLIELEEMTGLFVLPLPLRTDLSGNPTLREAIVRVRQATIDASRYQDIPFQEVLSTLYPDLKMTFLQVFTVWINMVNEKTESVRSVGDLSVENISIRKPSAKFDLSLYISDGEQIKIDLIYKKLLFHKSHMANFIEQYENLLQRFISLPHTRILEQIL